MSSFRCIAAMGRSIESLLNQSFNEAGSEPVPGRQTHAVLVRTEDFKPPRIGTEIPLPALTVYFYRVEPNKVMRASWSATGSRDDRAHLPLDLHFLITAWADNAEHELRILGRAMECLESTPILQGPLLDPSSGWAPNETVQIVLGEMSVETTIRTFDKLPTDYKLSVPYVARVARIDSRQLRATPQTKTVTTILTPKLEGSP